MNLTPYFEKFNEIQNMPYLKIVILIIAVSTLIIGTILEKKDRSNWQLDKFIFSIVIGMVILVAIVTGMNIYNKNFVVQPFIKETRVAINEKLNTQLTTQQVENLLEDQPTWANHVTKSEIEERD